MNDGGNLFCLDQMVQALVKYQLACRTETVRSHQVTSSVVRWILVGGLSAAHPT